MWPASGAAAGGRVVHFRLPPLPLAAQRVVVAGTATRHGAAAALPRAHLGYMASNPTMQWPTAAMQWQQRQRLRQRQRRRILECRKTGAGTTVAAAGSNGGSQAAKQAPAAAAAEGEEAAAEGGNGAAAGEAGQGGEAAAAAAAAAQQQTAAGSLSLSDLWALLRPDWTSLAACVLFTAFSVGCAVMVAPTLGKVVDIISRGTAATPRELAVAVGRLGAVYICSNVSLAIQVALSLVLGEGLAHRLRSRLFGALLSRDTLFFDRVKTGQMVAWLGQDIEVLQGTVAKLLGARGIRSAFETTGIILVLFSLSWPLAAALLVSAPLLTPLIARLSAAIGTASRASTAASNDVSAAADEIVENVRVVKLFAQQQRELGRFQGLLDGTHELAVKVLRLQALLDASSRVRNTLCVLCTLGLGAYMALNSSISLGTCYTFLVFSFSFSFALGNLTNTVGDLARAAGAVNRTMATLRQTLGDQADLLLAADDTNAHRQQQGQQEERRQLDDCWQGDIVFQDVGFSHPGGWSLRDVSLRIPQGKTVALVGPSGGGKSTIASLLMGLYSPSQGAILVDGVLLSELDMQWWRRQLGVVMQEPGLLTGRVADIIRYGAPDASDADVEWAARAAQAHDFIMQLPEGYQTAVGGGSGQELSGGQRQRLAIARALLRRPRVLVLDEATSALDVETEVGVTRELEAAGRGVSSLIIAHRLSTVRRADWIVVVADGRVVEAGTHEHLMAQPGGVYWKLVRTAESKGRESWDLPADVSAVSGSVAGAEAEQAGRAETGMVAPAVAASA